MKDFLRKYQNKKIIWDIYVMVLALVMAFMFNFLVLDNSILEKSLKTSILDSQENNIKADIYFEKENGKIFLKNSKNMLNTKNISFSIIYDNSNLQIDEVKSDFWRVEMLWERMSWIETFILDVWDKDLKSWNYIAEIIFSKREKSVATQLNLLNSNFTDLEENIFHLTSSGISL